MLSQFFSSEAVKNKGVTKETIFSALSELNFVLLQLGVVLNCISPNPSGVEHKLSAAMKRILLLFSIFLLSSAVKASHKTLKGKSV